MIQALSLGGSARELTRGYDIAFVIMVQIPGLVANGQGIKCKRPVQVEEVIKSGVPVEVAVIRVQLVGLVRRTGAYGLDVLSKLP